MNVRRLSFGFFLDTGIGIFFFAAVAGSTAESAPPPEANWRYGEVQITELGAGRVRLYMSLRNQGNPSQEPVGLYIVPSTVSAPSGSPTLLLTNQTQGKRSTIVQAAVRLPAVVSSASTGQYRLFLLVKQTITDMLPVEEGKPHLQSAERRRFQR